jgi:hypothetical protein
MDVDFFSDDPRRKARPRLDDILIRGVDQLVIACCFCTAAGVQILQRHVSRLGKVGSFAVVSVAPPTDYAALADLHRSIPDNLFVHWGAFSPVEKKASAALMHSKVFYARAGNECWLWTGSHNLTGNATQGGNCEAAVLLHGTADEQPFMDALTHLQTCRNESTLYDPNSLPPGGADRADLLAIHAETDVVPTDPLPWHIHLCLNTADFDQLLDPPADVRLFLYPRGSLHGGWQHAAPIVAYSGSLTGLNLTARNPQTGHAGVLAEWRAATFSITEVHGVLVLGPDSPPGGSVTTQAVLNIAAQSPPDEILFSEEPKIVERMLEGERSLSSIDPDMKRFFDNKSVQGTQMVHLPIIGRRFVIKVPAYEARQRDFQKIQHQVSPELELPIELIEPSKRKLEKHHPFIIRARYRLSIE